MIVVALIGGVLLVYCTHGRVYTTKTPQHNNRNDNNNETTTKQPTTRRQEQR